MQGRALPPDVARAVDGWTRDPSPLRLACGVQHYAWGQRGADAFIPRLLGAAPEPGRPYAELWIGAHPVLPARVMLDGLQLGLDELVAAAPEAVLGVRALQAFGPELPFLTKVLAAELPLSIQAHPNRAQAEEGFAREEAAGVPVAAPERSYRDRHHKPELIVALTPFHALEGFRPRAEILAALAGTPELAPLLAVAPPPGDGEPAGGAEERAWLRRLFETCMAPEAREVGEGLAALLGRLEAEDRARPFGERAVEHWFLRAARELSAPGAPDRGLLAFFLLNFVRLQPGQALFLDAGELHAYLGGVGVEVMASSDNVLRGGLTPKRVDVPELLRVLTFRAAPAEVLTPRAGGVYPTPAPEFEAAALALDAASAPVPWPGGAGVLLGLEGRATLDAGSRALEIAAGQAVLIPAALGGCAITPAGGPARVFRTTIPVSAQTR
jgi:mannose-6-phosphate isomerase